MKCFLWIYYKEKIGDSSQLWDVVWTWWIHVCLCFIYEPFWFQITIISFFFLVCSIWHDHDFEIDLRVLLNCIMELPHLFFTLGIRAYVLSLHFVVKPIISKGTYYEYHLTNLRMCLGGDDRSYTLLCNIYIGARCLLQWHSNARPPRGVSKQSL